MNHFSIKDIENLCGIKAHTLRIWEQRYQILVPKRKESNHRFYDNEDLKHILRVAYLYHSGYKISKIAQLKEADIKKLTIDIVPNEHYIDVFVNQMLEASIDFDEERFEKVLNTALLHLGFEKCILQVIYPFLERLGLMWMTDNVIPAQEHFASNIIKRKIIVAIDGLEGQQENDSDDSLTLLFTPEGEYHDIPLLLMQFLLKKKGKKAVYFGPNVPMDNLDYYLSRRKATHLYFHLITNMSNREVDDLVTDLCERFRKYQLIMSGPLTRYVNSKHTNLRLVQSLDEMMLFTSA